MGFSDRGYSRDSGPPFMADWTAVMTIMVANIALWVANLALAGEFRITEFLSLEGDMPSHLMKAWQLVSYGFVHDPTTPWHLVGNMLMLWFFGREVEEIMGRGEFFRFYFTAVVLAGLAWLASVHLFSDHGSVAHLRLLGASGAIMAVFAVFVWYFPNQTVLLWFVLPVPVWALGLLYLVLDLQGAADGGGHVAHVAHVAGGLFGLCYAWRGWNLSGIGDFSDGLSRRLRGLRRGMRVVRPPDDEDDDHGRPSRRLDHDDAALQEAVDRILEKISRSGEASLTTAERETLTQASRRLKERMR